MHWIWFILIVFVVALDLATSNILLSWLSLGFLPAWILGFYVDFWIQAVVALLIGFIALFYGNRLSKKYIRQNISTDPILLDKYIGHSFVAEHAIAYNAQHKVNGIYWQVRNIGHHIQVGDRCSIVAIEENKLIIRKEEN